MPTVTPRRLAFAFAPLAFLWAAPAAAQTGTPEEICAGLFPNWYQVLDRNSCVKERRRQKKTRACVAKDSLRMERQAAAIKNGITETTTMAQAKAEMERILKRAVPLKPAEDDAAERELVVHITSECASAYQFVVRVRAEPGGRIRFVTTAARFAPEGYADGERADLSKDFEGVRRARAEAARRRAAAQARRRAQERHRIEAARLRAEEAERQRRAAEAAKLRQAAEEKRRRAEEARRRRQALAAPPPIGEHCAPDLTRQERIRRLGRFGVVRPTGAHSYRAGGHRLSFAPKGAGLEACD